MKQSISFSFEQMELLKKSIESYLHYLVMRELRTRSKSHKTLYKNLYNELSSFYKEIFFPSYMKLYDARYDSPV